MPLPQSVSSVTPRSARHLVYRHLHDWIVYGPLEPGEQIRDAEVAEALGVSRTPVREALLRLAEEGLVEIHPGSGTRVAPLDLEYAGHAFAIGAVLDAFAAQCAAGRIPDQDVARMKELLSSMTAEHDLVRLLKMDDEFHRIYYLHAHNPPLAEMLDSLMMKVRRFDRAGFHDTGYLPSLCDGHEALILSLASGDAVRAGEAARMNWIQCWHRIRDMEADFSEEEVTVLP